MNLNKFYDLIKDICPTFHYESDSSEYPRQVYTEYASTNEYASNGAYEKVVSINLEHFTKNEFDETEKILEYVLTVTENISFAKETSFNEKDKVITNSYDVEIREEILPEELFKEIGKYFDRIKENE